jgi:hypothetical protein
MSFADGEVVKDGTLVQMVQMVQMVQAEAIAPLVRWCG